MPASIYYIRPNATSQLPANLLFLDCETRGEVHGDVELHSMYLAVTWRMRLRPDGSVQREDWRDWSDRRTLCEYVAREARQKAPLYCIGSNITFDLFATGLIEYLEAERWTCDTLYDKGLVTILICAAPDGRRIKFLAAQNWLQGSVREWGELLGLEKGEVTFTEDHETIAAYCRRDVEITGRAVLGYMGFVREHDMGGFALTAAGQAFRCFRHRFMKHRSILHYDQAAYNRFTRAAYTGGRVECGHIGKLRGEFVKLDINSMYPHVMRNNVYPAKIKQWIRDPSIEAAAAKCAKYCSVAEVELYTDEPAYAVRSTERLLFPVGTFTTYLCTESMRYALAQGHVVKVRQLMTFEPLEMFADYVDYFYPLKARYKADGNGVYEKTTKLMLNGLYGKFGEQRSREISRRHTPDALVTRVPGVYEREALEEEHPKFDWRYEPLTGAEPTYVPGVRWSLLHTTVEEVSVDEGAGSAPMIAAHVTDYARMLLYRYMRLVGLDRVLYCDTDSLIIHAEDVGKLEGVIDATALGALKIEGEATEIDIRGAKDYSFGDDLRRKGIRANAERVCRRCTCRVRDGQRRCSACGERIRVAAFRQAAFPGFYSLLRRGHLGSFPVGTVTKSLTTHYSKGRVNDAGDVSPLVMVDGITS